MRSSLILLVFILFVGCEKRQDLSTHCPDLPHAHKDTNLSLSHLAPELAKLSCAHLQYWNHRAKKELDKALEYEMPYQRFIHPRKWYEDAYAKDEKNFTAIQLEIIPQSKEKAIIKTKKIWPNGHYVMTNDVWYLVNGKWYHKIIPPASYLPILGSVDE